MHYINFEKMELYRLNIHSKAASKKCICNAIMISYFEIYLGIHTLKKSFNTLKNISYLPHEKYVRDALSFGKGL